MAVGKLALVKLIGAAFLFNEVTKKKKPAPIHPAPGAPPISYKFSPAHLEVQNRIDRLLGSGFNTIQGFAQYYGGSAGMYCTFANASQRPGNQILNCLPAGTVKTKEQVIANGTHTYVHELYAVYNEPVEGWSEDDTIHGANPDEAMQQIFHAVTHCVAGDCQFGSPLSHGMPQDDYKAYSYPSPIVAAQYGNNLPHFIRCGTDVCRLIGQDISIAQALLLIGGIAATIITGGSALPLITTALTQFISSQHVAGMNLQDAHKTVSELVNVANGADTQVSNGTTAELKNLAMQFINGNQDLFVAQ